MEPENPNFLPEEILIEIFSKLPAKAVGRCRCLSKTWRTHLSTSQFVNLHLRCRTSPGSLLLLIYNVDHSVHTIDAPIVVDNTVSSRKLDLGIRLDVVLGSCNGLVLLSNSTEEELYLVNPNTLQHFKLPPLSLISYGFSFIFSRYGLGYDTLSDDYKVVAFTFCSVRVPLRFKYDRLISVYCAKSGAWKRVDDSHDCSDFPTMHCGSFVNGAIHWYSTRKNTDSDKIEYLIGAFDFTSDVFHEIPAPPRHVSYRDITLLVLEGCLCMSSADNSSGNFDIWMMKQYGLADSWTKFTISTNRELRLRRLLCSLGDREIVFVTEDDTLVVYNLREGTTRVMILDGVPVGYFEGVAFVNSLVSPNHQYSN